MENLKVLEKNFGGPNSWRWRGQESFRSGFQTETERDFVPVTLYVWPFVTFATVTKCYNFEYLNSVTRFGFVLVFLAAHIWSHFVHKCHKWSQIQMWLVQTCLFFWFRWKRFGMNEIRQNLPECELCFCFWCGIRIWTALSPKLQV